MEDNYTLQIDESFTVSYASPAAEWLFKDTFKKLAGHSVEKILSPFIKKNTLRDLLNKAHTENQTILLDHYHLSIIKVQNVSPSIFILSLIDTLTFLRHAHSTAEDYLANVIKNSPGYLYLKDRQSRYIISNDNFAKAAGLKSAADIVGLTDYDLAWGETEADLFVKGDQEILTGVRKINFEEPQKQADGKTITVLANKVPLYSKGKEVIGILGNYFDITERKEQELKLISAEKTAKTANEAKSLFIASMSHDLRTPLVGIVGITEILQRRLKEDELLDFVSDMAHSCNAILNLINEILDFSKVEAGEVNVNMLGINLHDVLSTCIKNISAAAKKKGIAFHIAPENPPPLLTSTDPALLQRIINNLLSNALKFTDAGSILLTVTHPKDKETSFSITVKDTGIGISEDKLPHVFERFFRVDPSFLGHYKGTGLGLAITQNLVNKLGGSISVSSQLGIGTEFICQLPYIPVEQSSKSWEILPASPDLSPADNKKALRTVMLVEDNLIAQRVTKSSLELLNCKVIVADSAIACIEKIHANVDLIFMDIGLPDQSGVDTAHKLKENPEYQHIPIIGLTGHAISEENFADLDDCIQKPATLSVLEKKLKKFNLS